MPELKPHQKVASDYIEQHRQLILADDMGLGKTATMLKGIEKRILNGKKFMVVCPASLKMNWCHEIKMWLGIDVKPDIYSGPITVTNYERLRKWLKYAKTDTVDGIIFDEAHYLKNPKSIRHILANECTNHIFTRYLITGTPMVSGPCDIAALLEIIGLLPLFGGYESFYKRYCDPIWTGYGWDYSGSSNTKELHDKLKRFMIRRTKEECGLVLPKKEIIEINVGTLNQPYADSFEMIEKQTLEVNKRKWAFAVQWIINFEAEQKAPVIFVHHKYLMNKLMKRFEGRCVAIYGGQSIEERDKAVQDFQSGKAHMIFCSLQASATGITLTRSHIVMFLEYLWSPSISEQAMDRVHRISQTNDVKIFELYCKGSIEMQKSVRCLVKKLDMEGIL